MPTLSGLRRRIRSARILRTVQKRCSHVGTDCMFAEDVSLIGYEHLSFGDRCFIGPESRIEAWSEYEGEKFSPTIELDNDVRIHSKCHIGAITKIHIGAGTLLGSEVFITDHSHGRITLSETEIEPTHRHLYSKGPVDIGKNVWIGERAVILPNVKVGDYAVIGAMSVVTHDIPPYAVAVGNPARVVKLLDKTIEGV